MGADNQESPDSIDMSFTCKSETKKKKNKNQYEIKVTVLKAEIIQGNENFKWKREVSTISSDR